MDQTGIQKSDPKERNKFLFGTQTSLLRKTTKTQFQLQSNYYSSIAYWELENIGCMESSVNFSLRCSSSGTPLFVPTSRLFKNPTFLPPFRPNINNPIKLSFSTSPWLRRRRMGFATVNSHMATEKKSISEDRMLVSFLHYLFPFFHLKRCSLFVFKIGLIVFLCSFKMFVPPHLLIKHWISVLRNEQTPCPIFSEFSLNLAEIFIIFSFYLSGSVEKSFITNGYCFS
ncbi:hypothetical protein DITRI_Ditri06bG0079600 [Diplodiscus trichospermus]